MINITGCCCGGPCLTMVRFGPGGVRPINPADDLVPTDHTRTKNWPTWATAWGGISPAYEGTQAGGPLKALRLVESGIPVLHHIVFNTVTRQLINGLAGHGFYPFSDVPSNPYATYLGGVYALDLEKQPQVAAFSDVASGVFNFGPIGLFGAGGSGGAAPNIERISFEDANDLIDDNKPSGGDWPAITGAFAGGTNDRLYGWFTAESGATDDPVFVAWSVKYDGTDYAEEFTITDGDENRVPHCLTVADGAVYCCGVNDDGEIVIYKDGAMLAEMSDGSAQVDGDSVTATNGQAYILTGAKLAIVASGSVDDQQLTFVATAGGDSFDLTPLCVGYDPEKKCAVVYWDDGTGLRGYITYFTKPLEPGNVIEQDGVKIYGSWQSVGFNAVNVGVGGFAGIRAPTPLRWGCVIPGRMPRPLTVTAGDIEEPPPEDEKNCDGLTGCETIPGATMWLQLPENYTETTTDGGFPFGDLITEWFPQALADQFDLEFVDGSTYTFELSLVPTDIDGDPITGEYGTDGDEAGRLIRRRTADDDITYPHTYREDWAYRVQARCTCANGIVTFTDVQWDVQTFQKLSGDDPDTPPDFVGLFGTVAPHVDDKYDGNSFPCSSGQISAGLTFTDMLDGAEGDFEGGVSLYIGAPY